MTVRVGVIGAGSWAISSHLPNFARHDDVEFVAVARHGDEALQRVKDMFGFRFASEDFREVVSHELDVVLVASPSSLHCEHAWRRWSPVRTCSSRSRSPPTLSRPGTSSPPPSASAAM